MAKRRAGHEGERLGGRQVGGTRQPGEVPVASQEVVVGVDLRDDAGTGGEIDGAVGLEVERLRLVTGRGDAGKVAPRDPCEIEDG
jgi:hypothetical protein